MGNLQVNLEGNVYVQVSEFQIHLIHSTSSHRSKEDTHANEVLGSTQAIPQFPRVNLN